MSQTTSLKLLTNIMRIVLGKVILPGLRSVQFHPLAKIIAVVDEFCLLAIANPNSQGMNGINAIEKMLDRDYNRYDLAAFKHC